MGPGTIPSKVRFQVLLPPPLACIHGHLRPEFHEQLEPFYERRILDSLNAIIGGILAHDLAIEWGLPFEVIDLEYGHGRFPNDFSFKPHFRLSNREYWIGFSITVRVSRNMVTLASICATVSLGASALLNLRIWDCWWSSRMISWRQSDRAR